MEIAVVGTGYVGLVTGTCFAEMGSKVVCIDVDSTKINNLNSGIMPIFELGIEELVIKNKREGRLSFDTNIAPHLDKTSVIFCAVGTPPDEDGRADLKYVLDVARTIGRNAVDYFIFVTKSTVPVGTAAKVKATINEEFEKRGVKVDFDVVSNPEFLKEGAAVKDFTNPDRIVIGVESDKARHYMEKLYQPFILNGVPIIFMDIASAEMTKYASNAMLATRISFMNEMANLCEIVGADIEMVRQGMGADNRIGSKFLNAGCGYGGSCFPKDVKALAQTGKENGYLMSLINAVESVNEEQKKILFKKLETAFDGNLKDKTIAILGLAFKPETDDMREASSLILINRLLEIGVKIKAYDPIAMDESRRRIGDAVEYCDNIYEAVKDADAMVLVTEWKQFRLPDWDMISKIMRGNIIVDGRNIYNEEELKKQGFKYYRIGKKN